MDREQEISHPENQGINLSPSSRSLTEETLLVYNLLRPIRTQSGDVYYRNGNAVVMHEKCFDDWRVTAGIPAVHWYTTESKGGEKCERCGK